MSMEILGVGTALPEHVVSQDEAEAAARTLFDRAGASSDKVVRLFRLAGVRTRNMVFPPGAILEWMDRFGVAEGARLGGGPGTAFRMQIYGEAALRLALAASRRALETSEMEPRAITHLVTVSCTGFNAPGLDVRLLEGLGLRPDTERLHVGFMGCHGAVNGLRAARAFTGADPAARVLLAAVEICSIHFTYDTDREKYMGNALFSDGAAALVGGACPGRGPWRLIATGSCLLPDSSDDMTWRIGDHGFEMRLTKRVPRLIRDHLGPWFEEWLGRSGLRIADVGSWAIHPGGPRILTAAEEALGLPHGTASVSREVLSEHGNMSSPTILFILERLAARGAPRPCVALGFGPGLVAEAALLA